MIISSKNLIKNFGNNKAIKSLNFTINNPGTITGLVGPDGAGKTTLIRLLAGLLKPTSGELIVLDNFMPKNNSTFLQNIGYMPQKFGLYEDLTVLENLNLYADLQNIKNPSERVKELLNFTNLKDFKNRMAGKLSGGMKQKLGLACSLIKKPKLLLLDEPGVGVDPISRQELWNMTQKLLDEKISIIWATSYLDEAELCDKVILLNEGEILFLGKPKEIEKQLDNRVYFINSQNNNKKDLLTKLLEKENILDAFIVGNKIRIILKQYNKEFLNKILTLEKNLTLEKEIPNFEDAFIDILQIKTQAHSKLANKMHIIKENKECPIFANKLSKKFGDFQAAKDINIKMNRGEIFGILGPNGAGKSTTFKMLCGLLKPTCGEAYILGKNLYKEQGIVKNKIGYMAQKFSLYGNLGLEHNLNFFAGIYGLRGKEKKEKINEMIDIFSFRKYLGYKVDDLSLGLKQRLALACSVMHEPEVLFLDEATSGVDPITRKEFWTHINAMVKKGISIIITTHLMNEAEYCDRLMLVYKGTPIALGTPNELKAKAGKNFSMQDTFIKLIKDEENKNEF